MKKVLIVDDNPVNLKLFQYALKPVQAEFTVARDGNEAIEKISSERPDLVILDIQIPGISGLEVAKRVKSDPELKDTILVAVTAYSMEGDKQKILAAGCDWYISKPIDTRAFPQVIQRFLDGEGPPEN
ncbi:MAG: response regulator [Promethearchaeota archaeon]